MKNKLLLLLVLNVQIVLGQVTLEHTYHSNTPSPWVYKVSSSEWDYITFTNNVANIYSINHSLIKSVTLQIPPSAKYAYGFSLTNNTFTTDNKYVVGYVYSDTITNISTVKFIEDDGTVVLSLDTVYSTGIIYNTSQGTKYIVSTGKNFGSGISTHIYSLPGSYSALSAIHSQNGDNESERNSFPNPTNDMIHLTYNLKNGEQGMMYIINETGQTIAEYKVDAMFNEVLFDSSALQSGTYFYFIDTNKFHSETKQFIKN